MAIPFFFLGSHKVMYEHHTAFEFAHVVHMLLLFLNVMNHIIFGVVLHKRNMCVSLDWESEVSFRSTVTVVILTQLNFTCRN